MLSNAQCPSVLIYDKSIYNKIKMITHDCYTLGLDFGSDSVRALVVNVRTGEEVASEVHDYNRWKKGMYCDATKNQFRQHPYDHVETMTKAVCSALTRTGDDIRTRVRSISVDTTGSTPCLVDTSVVPLCEKQEFQNNPNAMFMLWKDHCAVAEAEEINAHNANSSEDYLKYAGGSYSAEWFWAKLIYLLRCDTRFSSGEYSFIEHCDWVCALLTSCKDIAKVKRSRCAAGHKALWNAEFGGLPPLSFFEKIEPSIAPVYKNLYTETFTCDVAAGTLSEKWAETFGLSHDVVVGVGALDAHMGAVGAGIKPYNFVRVMGTSTCDIVTTPYADARLIKGICGQVDGSVLPQMIGFEAGQSSFGDVFAWFKEICTWSDTSVHGETEVSQSFLTRISNAAAKIPPSISSPIALDWLNGRRTPHANQRLTSGIIGLHLGSDAPTLYRAFAESVAFGARAIVECFESQGIVLNEIIAIGGVAQNSPFIMQVLADVLSREVRVVASGQCCALGTAICAAVAAGIYECTEKAIEAMASKVESVFTPRNEYKEIYNTLYKKYRDFGNFIEKFV